MYCFYTFHYEDPQSFMVLIMVNNTLPYTACVSMSAHKSFRTSGEKFILTWWDIVSRWYTSDFHIGTVDN